MADKIWNGILNSINLNSDGCVGEYWVDYHRKNENWQIIGDVYFSRGELDSALNYYQKFLEKARGWDLYNTCIRVALVFHNKGEVKKTIDFLIKSVEKYEDNLIYHGDSSDLLLKTALKLSIKYNFDEPAFKCVEKFKKNWSVERSVPLIAKCEGFEKFMKTVKRDRFEVILSELNCIYEMEDERFYELHKGWLIEDYRPKDYYEPLMHSLKINLERLEKEELNDGRAWYSRKEFTMKYIIEVARRAGDFKTALEYCREYQEYTIEMKGKVSIEYSINHFIKTYEAKGDFINVAKQYVLLAEHKGDEYYLINAIDAYEKCGNYVEAGEKSSLIADRAARIIEEQYKGDVGSAYRENNIKKFKKEEEKYFKKAVSFFQKAREWRKAAEMYQEANMSEDAALMYDKLAQERNMETEFDPKQKAAEMYEKAAGDSKQKGDIDKSKELYLKAANYYLELNNCRKSISCLRYAEKFQEYFPLIFPKFDAACLLPVVKKNKMGIERGLVYLRLVQETKDFSKYPAFNFWMKMADKSEPQFKVKYYNYSLLSAYWPEDKKKALQAVNKILSSLEEAYSDVKDIKKKNYLLIERVRYTIAKINCSEDVNLLEELNMLHILYLSLNGSKIKDEIVMKSILSYYMLKGYEITDLNKMAVDNFGLEVFAGACNYLLNNIEASRIDEGIRIFKDSMNKNIESSEKESPITSFQDVDRLVKKISYLMPERLIIGMIYVIKKQNSFFIQTLDKDLNSGDVSFNNGEFKKSLKFYENAIKNPAFNAMPDDEKIMVFKVMCRCAIEIEDWEKYSKYAEIMSNRFKVPNVLGTICDAASLSTMEGRND